MDWLKITASKRDDNSKLYSRMDADRNMAVASAYAMKNLKGNKADDVANVTLPEPKAFLEKCCARLIQLQRQVVVDSDTMDGRKLRTIENFINDVDYEADMRLARKGQKDRFAQLSEFVCLRGPIAEQILTRVDGDRYIADKRVLDTRFFLYEAGEDGVWWGAPTMLRSALDIEKEYGVVIQGDSAEVMDCWDENEEVVFIDGKEVKRQPNPYGFAPFIVQIPASGLSIQEKDYMHYRGESIYSLLRNHNGDSIFDEANFCASIMKTMSFSNIKPALQYRSDAGESKEIEEYAGDAGVVASVEKNGGGYELMPFRDVTNATRIYKQIIDINKQLATYTILDFGTTTMPLSGTAMSKLSNNKNELLLNRLNAIAFLLQQDAYMTIKQFPTGRSINIGEEGHRKSYTQSDLDGEYSIKYKFSSNDIEELSKMVIVAGGLRGIYSEDTIREKYLDIEDPKGEAQKIASEELAAENEVIANYRKLHALIDEAKVDESKNLEAWIVLEKLVNLIERTRLDAKVPLSEEPNKKAAVANTNPLAALFNQKGGGETQPQEAIDE
ncbi:MAG: hypothetical protein GX825_03420 [Syntrophomonadaceae bacterium]|nr:hypothetical protein [Syntrophomonadaceae bacterium]